MLLMFCNVYILCFNRFILLGWLWDRNIGLCVLKYEGLFKIKFLQGWGSTSYASLGRVNYICF